MPQYLTEIELEALTCDCGITWAAPVEWFKQRREDHKAFFCPNGCHRYFAVGSNEVEKLKKRLADEQNCCIRAREEATKIEASRRAWKGVVTKLKKKVKE